MSRRILPALIVALAVCVLAWPSPASAWLERGFGWGGWHRPPWGTVLVVPPYRYAYPSPYGYAYPPGSSLSYSDPANGTTYCLSERLGVYYPCGYSPPAPYPAGVGSPVPPPPAPPVSYGELPPPSGILVFRLPVDAEAALDGAPVGLSRGLGIAAVPPGEHRLMLRVAGAETTRTISVHPHAIFIVTPGAITPSQF